MNTVIRILLSALVVAILIAVTAIDARRAKERREAKARFEKQRARVKAYLNEVRRR